MQSRGATGHDVVSMVCPLGVVAPTIRLIDLSGHSIIQLRMIFRPLSSEHFLAYVQHFNIVPQQGTVSNVHPRTGMHMLRCAVRADRSRIGEVVPITQVQSPAHLIPNFGKEAHPHLMRENSYKASSEFWLNKYWSKQFYFALSY